MIRAPRARKLPDCAEDSRDAIRNGKDPESVAREVRRIIEARNPGRVCRVNGQAKILPVLKALTPHRVWDALFGRYGRARGGTGAGAG
jgi:hypothetical protein